MITPSLSNAGLMAIMILTFTSIITLYCSRQWILRRRTYTYATRTADIGLHFALLIHMGEMGMAVFHWVEEEQITRRIQDPAKQVTELMTRGYLIRMFVIFMNYIIELWMLKLAYLGYYFHLRQHFSHKSKILYHLTCIYTVAGFIAVMAVTLGVCWPIPRSWTLPTHPDFCNPMLSRDGNTVLVGINLSNDLLILFLGLHIIVSLNLGARQKAGLFFAAGVGFLSIVMCGVRFFVVYTAITNQRSTTLEQYHLIIGVGALELAFAFGAFCLPSFRVIWTQWWGKHSRNSNSWGSGEGLAGATIGGSGRQRQRIRVEESVMLSFNDKEEVEGNDGNARNGRRGSTKSGRRLEVCEEEEDVGRAF